MRWWPFRRRDICTPADFARIQAEVARDAAYQDALDEEYIALTDRPTVARMVRETETSEPRPVQCIDLEHYERWCATRRAADGR